MRKEKTTGEIIGGCIGALIFLAAVDFFMAWVIQLLWNALIPALAHGPHIGYWTAFLIMCALSIVGGYFKSSTTKSS